MSTEYMKPYIRMFVIIFLHQAPPIVVNALTDRGFDKYMLIEIINILWEPLIGRCHSDYSNEVNHPRTKNDTVNFWVAIYGSFDECRSHLQIIKLIQASAVK